MFDYDKLRGKIKEVYRTQKKFAKSLGIGTVSLSQRLNNQLEFTSSEISKSCDLLNVPLEEIPVYFFRAKVQKDEPNEEPKTA